jgi:hypothetical protein
MSPIPAGLRRARDQTVRMAAGNDLYELDPKEFTAARDRLAAELRKAGDREAAAEVKALRRPTVTAWALNQLARRHGDEVRMLVAASAEVARAQVEASGGGDAATFRKLTRERRELVHRLAGTAAALLDEREAGSGAGRRDALVSALESASMDEEGGEALLAGRLATEPQPSSGFGGFLTAAATAVESAPGRRGPSRREVSSARDRAERARSAATEAADAAAAADERVEAAARQLDEARARAERAHARADELAAAADEAERALSELDG